MLYRLDEKAQILPIIAIALIAIVLLAAVILDGGTLMSNRRTAQAAADAGALAGAKVYCDTRSESAAISAATTYAINNRADSAIVTVDEDGVTKVTVSVEIQQGSFFAKIFGRDELVSTAVAGAGCFPPDTYNGLLPVAWSCRPPVGGSVSEDCEYFPLDWETQIKPIADTYAGSPTDISQQLFSAYNTASGYYIYIIMDSDKTCGVDIDCDFNDDGKNEIESGGNRGWLNLEGTSSGTPNLTGWIQNGVSSPISVHTWFSGVDGNKTSVYSSMETRLDQIVWIPVFNVLCGDVPDLDDPNDPCILAAHASTPPGLPLLEGEVENVLAGNPATPMFHVIAFAPFYITCVHKSGEICPGFEFARTINPTIKANTNTVEGYFVKDPPFVPGDVGTGGADLGNYVISLTK